MEAALLVRRSTTSTTIQSSPSAVVVNSVDSTCVPGENPSRIRKRCSIVCFRTILTYCLARPCRCESVWHTGLTCSEYRARTTQEAQKLINESSDMCRCPRCSHVIQRNGGCLHMTCRCGSDFCAACKLFLSQLSPANKCPSGRYVVRIATDLLSGRLQVDKRSAYVWQRRVAFHQQKTDLRTSRSHCDDSPRLMNCSSSTP